ncbi:MAG: hypothetical protein ACOVNR_00160, partial [Chitinophagaceae bacterium]
MNWQIPIEPVPLNTWNSVSTKLRQWVFIEKLKNPFGFVTLTLLSCLFALLIAKKGFVFGVLIMGGIMAPPIVYALVTNPQLG